MRISTVDSLNGTDTAGSLPLHIEHRSGGVGAAFFLLVLLPAMAAMLLPVAVLVAMVLTDPTAQAAVSAKSNSAMLIALGLGVWATLWGVPAWRFFCHLGARRVVSISQDIVWVEDKTLFGSRAWSCPLSEFDGLAHNVRTLMSGARHELILRHVNPLQCILVDMAPLITENGTTAMARMLGVSVISGQGRVHSDPVAPDVRIVDEVGAIEPLAA